MGAGVLRATEQEAADDRGALLAALSAITAGLVGADTAAIAARLASGAIDLGAIAALVAARPDVSPGVPSREVPVAAAGGPDQLAGLMRYQLDSSRQATVTVGTEAEYLANYIGLEKLRLRENTNVEFTADLPHPDRPLAPLLLLPLVENCFKHAIGPNGDNTIRIHLTQTDTSLTLRTGNSIPAQFRPAPSGLGLPTLRVRLAQFYPGHRHRLAVEASDTFYAANLQLVL